MRWIKFLLLFALLHGTIKQQLYFSSAQQTRKDERVSILQTYLAQKHSPLASSASSFIQIADTYKLDWKLLPSIAGVESGFETAGNTHDFNSFGYMCGSSPCAFLSYRDAIETVAKTISGDRAYTRYRQTGSIYVLAQTYNYVHPEDWTAKIEYFRSELGGDKNGLK